jgi:leucyl/phenylalanyl-tRNA--protein transferase
MPFFLPDHFTVFPPVEQADEDGLLAIGGTLSTEHLLLAYRSGIFPWFNDDELPMWWSPDPRFVLFPDKLKISNSMRQVLKRQVFEFRVDSDFRAVINYCRKTQRKEGDGTWITDSIVEAYTKLHELGYAQSAEAWHHGELVGGLYGIRMGNCFFGESMFSQVANASKFAFISYVQDLKSEGVRLIDCQVYTEHLESLGAEMIPREEFLRYLK